ncbi:MAG: IS1634 family transposase, partial [Deltaproteobacteria bacterium]|nr:IS1634 family transposase [Deltaproteobacteria bacterium]
RVDGKPKVVNQIYLGSVERILGMAAKENGGLSKIQVQEFGALWLANMIEREVGLVEIIDSFIPKGDMETGPSVGEYFLYAAFNHMIDACSKRGMPEWYKTTAIQHIRPVDIDALDFGRFWKKWNRVDEEAIRLIAQRLLNRVSELEASSSDCFLFDTTNYYTYMASDTDSELAMRGKNKEGRDWLRQIGLALLVTRDTRLPIFYREYDGTRHDSKLFARILDEVLTVMRAHCQEEVTVVFDKGMNAEENISTIDAMEKAHFITSYSTYLAEDLIHAPRERFALVDTPKNKKLAEQDRDDDRLVAWRTAGEYWGRERTVVITYNPLTATKQRFAFERRFLKLQAALYEIRTKVRTAAAGWRKQEKIIERYKATCEGLHLPNDLYELRFTHENGRLNMGFNKNYYQIGRHIDRFGKNILIADRSDWSTDEIVRASLDRSIVEQSFRQTKDDDLVAMLPIRHFTDSKIRCHILSCIVALSYLRIIELRLHRISLDISAATAMDSMRKLHSRLCWSADKKKPVRILEEPTTDQALILKAFGYEVVGGVLQKIST